LKVIPTNSKRITDVKITSLSGAIISKQKGDEVNIATVPPGLYIVKIIFDNKSFAVKKWIKYWYYENNKNIFAFFICFFEFNWLLTNNDKLKINLPADQLIEKSKDNNEYHQIQWKTDYKTQEPGNPELPVYRVTYVLPVNSKFKEVIFTNKEKKVLDKDVLIAPVQQPIPTNYSLFVPRTLPNLNSTLTD